MRAQLGLEFSGETRGVDQRFVTGDLEVKNLSNDVSIWSQQSHVTGLRLFSIGISGVIQRQSCEWSSMLSAESPYPPT